MTCVGNEIDLVARTVSTWNQIQAWLADLNRLQQDLPSSVSLT